MLAISRKMMDHTLPEMFFRGISAGFLIAAMVWLIPSANGAQFQVIVLMTYLIALGDFTHIVAGSVEAFLLVANGDQSLWSTVTGFTVPVLLGNIVGGTVLFALISYAQIMKEL
jgi:formate/nitrite transporter FocA (FNT family)